jgi:hypothetical protein
MQGIYHNCSRLRRMVGCVPTAEPVINETLARIPSRGFPRQLAPLKVAASMGFDRTALESA